MQAEVIAIGDEITSGQRLDTNTQWLSERLGEIGVRVLYHSTVGDDFEACRGVIENALYRADIVIATGGLGPTADDLTRQTISAATDRELQLDLDSLKHIEDLFKHRNRVMPERNQIQAMLPKGSQVIPNPHGTAPGIDLTFARTDSNRQGGTARMFALPGVPAEMKEMWTESVLPRLREIEGVSSKTIQHYRLKCFGVGESACEELLPDLIRRGRTPSVGITVHRGTITLRVTSEGESTEYCRRQMESTIATIHDCLGNLVFGEEDDELQDKVIRLLRQNEKTVSVCEWGTNGLIQNCLGMADMDRSLFLGGMTVNSVASLIDILHIEKNLTADPCGEALAQQMAEKIRSQFQTDFGLSITRFPDDESGHFAFAVATKDRCVSKCRPFASHPDIRHHLAAKTALNLLRVNLI